MVRQVIANHRLVLPNPDGHDPRIARTPEPPPPRLLVDATGVGRPVLDLVRQARMPADVRGATITAGDALSRDGLDYRVPKADLVGTLQLLLGDGRLKWAATLPLRAELEAELADFRVKLTAAAHESYGAWREGQHDDLVLALALASWGLVFAPDAPVGRDALAFGG